MALLENILDIFDISLLAEAHTHDSALGVGAILIQRHEGVQKVTYLGKQATVNQRKYSYELKSMAVGYASKYFIC